MTVDPGGYWLNGQFIRLGKQQPKHMALRVVTTNDVVLYENDFEWHDEASWTLLQDTLFLVGMFIGEQCAAAMREDDSLGWELQLSDVNGVEYPPGEWVTLQRFP